MELVVGKTFWRGSDRWVLTVLYPAARLIRPNYDEMMLPFLSLGDNVASMKCPFLSETSMFILHTLLATYHLAEDLVLL